MYVAFFKQDFEFVVSIDQEMLSAVLLRMGKLWHTDVWSEYPWASAPFAVRKGFKFFIGKRFAISDKF